MGAYDEMGFLADPDVQAAITSGARRFSDWLNQTGTDINKGAQHFAESFIGGGPSLKERLQEALSVSGPTMEQLPQTAPRDFKNPRSLSDFGSALKTAAHRASAKNLAQGLWEGAQTAATIPTMIAVPKAVQQVQQRDYLGAAGTVSRGIAELALFHALNPHPHALHPDAARQMVELTNATGGASVEAATGRNLQDTRHTAVSLGSHPDYTAKIPTKLWDTLSPEDQQALLHAHANQPHVAQVLQEPHTGLGIWRDDNNKVLIVEPKYFSRNHNAAMEAAGPQALNQQGVQRLELPSDQGYVPTGGDGNGIYPDHPMQDPAEWARHLESLQPPRTDINLRHHSNVKIAPDENGNITIDSSARFHSDAKGAEINRSGEPGSYWYDDKTPAEKKIAGHQFVYTMRKPLAIADVMSPEFDQARATGDGHAVEKAVKDAGYDGLTNSNWPGSYFLFGDHDAIDPTGGQRGSLKLPVPQPEAEQPLKPSMGTFRASRGEEAFHHP